MSWVRKAIEPQSGGDSTPVRAQAAPEGVTTFIDRGAECEGTLRIKVPARIDGEFRGEIESESTVIVGESAAVEANIRAREVLVCGAVVGDVRASRSVLLRASGRLHGDVETACLEIEKGALFNGRTKMARPEAALRARPDEPTAKPLEKKPATASPAPAA